jgi:hypothetical protein
MGRSVMINIYLRDSYIIKGIHQFQYKTHYRKKVINTIIRPHGLTVTMCIIPKIVNGILLMLMKY